MKQETLDFVVEKTNELINSATCCDELEEVANTSKIPILAATINKNEVLYPFIKFLTFSICSFIFA